MVADLRIEGAEAFGRLARVLKEVGDKELRKELYSGVNRSVKPLRADVKESAVDTLPRRGGLGAQVSQTKLTTSKQAGRDPGVRLVARPGAVRDPLRINRGRIRRPTFGHRPWVLQDVKPGWFTNPLEEGAPVVREDLVRVIRDIIEKIKRTL